MIFQLLFFQNSYFFFIKIIIHSLESHCRTDAKLAAPQQVDTIFIEPNFGRESFSRNGTRLALHAWENSVSTHHRNQGQYGFCRGAEYIDGIFH